MTWFRVVALVLAGVGVLLVAVGFFYSQIANPRVTRELFEQPDGKRAQKVMLLTLPSGRQIPVNYLHEGEKVYAGADGRWWKELAGEGGPVRVWIRGEALAGHGRAVRDDPAHRKEIFQRLRPNALEGFGTLVEIDLEETEPNPPTD